MLKRFWSAMKDRIGLDVGRYTDRSRAVLKMANQFAGEQGSQWIAPEHVLLAILTEGGGVGVALLEARQISISNLRVSLQQRHEAFALGSPGGRLPLTPQTVQMVRNAHEESLAVGDDYVGTQHLLLAAARAGDTQAGKVLASAGADLSAMREHLKAWRRLWLAQKLLAHRDYSLASAEFVASTTATPPDPISANQAAWFLATCPEGAARNGSAARRVAQELCARTNWAHATFVDTLAAACAETGDFRSAQEYQQKAIGLLTSEERRMDYQDRLLAYRQNRPWRESVASAPATPDLPARWPDISPPQGGGTVDSI